MCCIAHNYYNLVPWQILICKKSSCLILKFGDLNATILYSFMHAIILNNFLAFQNLMLYMRSTLIRFHCN